MSAAAAHLVDRVLPEAPIRKWVLSMPFAMHLRCSFEHELRPKRLAA